MLTLMGHWPELRVTLPNGAGSVQLPGSASHEHGGAERDHARHCHAGAASCGDQPAPGVVPLALLARTLECLVAGGALSASEAVASVRLRPAALELEPPPPRFSS